MPPQIHAGVIRAWNAIPYTARVTLTTPVSFHMSLDNVPVSQAIRGASMIVGHTVALVIFDETKADDAMIIGVT